MEDRLRTLFAEFRLGQSRSPMRSQQGESPDRKNPSKKEECATELASIRMRVEFPQWEDGEPTDVLSRVERYFHYHRTPEASMVDIAAIHLKGEAIQ
ncbi:hypothetical protein GW17_00019100 [Ensete ventricosum]|nr:hypothetical protein GW17_00019100 [Ensete ventricosum]RZR89769.1 hypothetical protein BHM03_00017548 [Ensete ventricosum]